MYQIETCKMGALKGVYFSGVFVSNKCLKNSFLPSSSFNIIQSCVLNLGCALECVQTTLESFENVILEVSSNTCQTCEQYQTQYLATGSAFN